MIILHFHLEDNLELEGDVVLLPDVLQHTNKVVTFTEAPETVEMTETVADEVEHKRIPRRRNRRCDVMF